MDNFALGTAQFGMDYGISNSYGQVQIDEVERIIQFCSESGISTLDTASSYGNAEKILGSLGVEKFKVISKFPPRASTGKAKTIRDWLFNSVEKTLKNLKISKLECILFHRSEDLIDEEALNENLLDLVKQNMINGYGLSIYSIDELKKLKSSTLNFTVIQAPFNLIDRTIDSKIVQSLGLGHTRFHARSAFLQGLLLMNRNNRPAYFSKWTTIWNEWDSWLLKENKTPIEACIAYLKYISFIDKTVFGVQSLSELKDLCKIYKSSKPLSSLPNIASIDENLIHPFNWKYN